jgi:hypothetical protein
MIDQDYRNFRIRDLAERILFAGVNAHSTFIVNSTVSSAVSSAYNYAEQLVDYGIQHYPIVTDECGDEEPATARPTLQDSL